MVQAHERQLTITALFSDDVFGTLEGAQRVECDWIGQTAAQVFRDYRPASWEGLRVAATIGGRRLEPDDWSRPLGTDVQIVFTVDPQAIDPISVLIFLAVSVAVNLASAALASQPDGRQPQQRGEDGSPTYAWDQAQTEYRSGMPVPWGFGLHDVAGQVIYTSVFASPGSANVPGPSEELSLILALSEGPIAGIGGDGNVVEEDTDKLGGFLRQIDAPNGPLPSDVRVNATRLDHTLVGRFDSVNRWWLDLPNAEASVRLGTIDQRPMPGFPGAVSTQVVNEQIDTVGSSAVFTVTETEGMRRLGFVISFPGGLYQQTPTGGPGPVNPGVQFRVEWRPEGNGPWQILGSLQPNIPLPGYQVSGFAFSAGLAFGLGASVRGPIDVRVTRIAGADPGGDTVSGAVWRQVSWIIDQQFANPGVALIGLRVRAGEQVTSGRSGYRVRCRLNRVRVWDASLNGGNPTGTAQREGDYWNVPASGDTFFGIWTYPPGRNPAWIVATILSHPRLLGPYVSDADIDWPAFRNWADYCDESVDFNGVPEAAFQADGVIDQPQAALDYIRRVCRAGRAKPIMRGRKFSVVYQYADAHGRGTNSVPAKAITQVFSQSNVRDFSVRYLNTFDRPAVLSLQFLNAEKDYAQDQIPVPDPDADVDDVTALRPLGFTKESHQLYGVTRPSQVVREGLFMHAANREVRSECSFQVGIDALACDVGDVIGVQHVAYRPFDTDAFARRFTQASGSGVDFTVNGDVTLPSGAYAVFRDASGAVVEQLIASAAGTYSAGDTITLDSAQDMVQGSPVVLGTASKLLKPYEVVRITLNRDLTREVTAVEWKPSIHALPDVSNLLETLDSDDEFAASPGLEDLTQDTTEQVATNFTLRKLPNGDQYVAGWDVPEGFSGLRAHLFARLEGGTSWVGLGTTNGTAFECKLTPGVRYEFTIVFTDRRGSTPTPDGGPVFEAVTSEFAPVPVSRPSSFVAEYDGDRREVVLRWQRVDNPLLRHYEVRKGVSWLAGDEVARTSDDTVVIQRVDFPGTGPLRFEAFNVAAVLEDGARSEIATAIVAGSDFGVHLIDDELDPAAVTKIDVQSTGATNVQWELLDTSPNGSIQDVQRDLGFQADGTLMITWTIAQALELMTLGEAQYELGSGEGRFRLLEGRDASPLDPGSNPDFLVGSALMTLGETVSQGLQLNGPRGTTGFNFRVRAFYRTAPDGGTLSAMPFVRYNGPVRTSCRYLQVGLELLRRGTSDDRTLIVLAPRVRYVI